MNPTILTFMRRALFEPHTLSPEEKEQYLTLLKTNKQFKKEVERLILQRVAEKLKVQEEQKPVLRTYTLAELQYNPMSPTEQLALLSYYADFYTTNTELESATHLCEQTRQQQPIAANRNAGAEVSETKNVLSSMVELPLNDTNCTQELLIHLNQTLPCTLLVRIMNNKNEIVQESLLPKNETQLRLLLHNHLTIGLYYCVVSPQISSPKDFALLKKYGTETRRFYLHKQYAPPP